MIFAIYFTSILVFLDLYGYYLRVKGTGKRYAAYALAGAAMAAGGFQPILVLGEPLVVPLAWAAMRYAKKNPGAAARRLPFLFGALFLAAALLFLNAHNTSESMFLSPHGVHYWLLNVLNGFLAGAVFLAEKTGADPARVTAAVKALAVIPPAVSRDFPGVAAYFSLLGGYAMYLVFRARLPEGALPPVDADSAFTPPKSLAAALAAAGVFAALAPPSASRAAASALVLFCALSFSASGLYFSLRLSGRRLSGTAVLLVCGVQMIIFLCRPLLWLPAAVGVAFRILGLYSFIRDYGEGAAVRPAPPRFHKIYIAPAAFILLLLPAKDFTEKFQSGLNEWLAAPELPAMPAAPGGERGPFAEIGGVRYSFDMDQYEYPNRPGEPPLLVKTAVEARTLCEVRGLRLCRLDEWEHACSSGGAQVRIKRYEKTTGGKRKLCNQKEKNLQPAGMKKYSDCRPDAFPVFDMAGNAWEIVETKDGLPVTALKGGYFGYSDDYTTACSYTLLILPGQAERLRETHFGFRCCR